MSSLGQTARLLLAIGAGLFGVALGAGIIQSMRVDGRLPAIDLLMHGSRKYIKHLLAQKDYEGAIAEIRMQARMGPLDANTRELLGTLLIAQGGICLQAKQPDLAARNFTEALELDPRHPQAFNFLGVALAQLGDLEQAEKCFANAIELAPDFVDARNNLERARKELRLAPESSGQNNPK